MFKKEGETIINLTYIDNLIEEGKEVIENHYKTTDPPGMIVIANHHFVPRNSFIKWKTKTINYLERNLDETSNYINEIKNEVKDNSFDEANKLLSMLLALKKILNVILKNLLTIYQMMIRY